MPEETSFTSRAVACLKAGSPESHASPGGGAPVLRDLGNGLAVAYMVVAGKELREVRQQHLRDDEIDADELHRTGIANLAAIADQRLQVFPHPAGHVCAVLLDGNFEAALILVDALWEGIFREYVEGQCAVAIPARDVLVFCDVSNQDGMDELAGVISRVVEGRPAYPVADGIYVRGKHGWEKLNPANGPR